MLKRNQVSVTEAAKVAGVTRSTLNNWLNGPNQLDVSRADHRHVAEKLAAFTSEDLETIENARQQAPTVLVVRESIAEYSLLDIFLHALKAPDVPKEGKEVAEQAIRDLSHKKVEKG